MTALPRVLSYPPVHDYVDRLHGTAATLVHRQEAWPRLPHFYAPEWLRAHADDWDVAHLHFTWEQYPVGTLDAVLTAHRAAGTPVVWTAHDLRNPHVRRGGSDASYLGLLATEAAAVLTLTPGAAAEVTARFGVGPQVVPHGPLVPTHEAAVHRRRTAARDGRADRPLRVLLLAKALRANLDWRTPLEVVRDLGPDDPPVHLDVHLHADVAERATIESFADGDRISVTVGERLSTTELWRRVADADALLLPYRWGTHSGLLELATDLGTSVIVSDVGYLPQQAPCHVVRSTTENVDASHLRSLLLEMAAGTRAIVPVPLSRRERVLGDLRRTHAGLYARLAAARGTAVGR